VKEDAHLGAWGSTSCRLKGPWCPAGEGQEGETALITRAQYSIINRALVSDCMPSTAEYSADYVSHVVSKGLCACQTLLRSPNIVTF
jgi:hypothetical protein